LEQFIVRRLKNSERVLLVILLIVATVAWVNYRYHFRIAAWWWHHQHGEVMAIADYSVPAPDNWYVEDISEDHRVMILLNQQGRIRNSSWDGKLPFTAVVAVSIRSSAWTEQKLNSWSSFEASQIKKRGVEPVFRKFSFDGETLSCVGGEKVSQASQGQQFYESDPNLWSCWSSGRLELNISATDAHMPQVWNVVEHIRRKS
jgi:hypothetical protein